MESLKGGGGEGDGGYQEDVRLLGGGGGSNQTPRHHHHINNSNQNFCTKNILRATLLFSLVALSCLVFFHSTSPVQYVFNITYNPLPSQSNEAIDTTISPQDLLSTQENLLSTMKISFDDHTDFSQASIAKENLPSSLKDNSIHRKQSFPTYDKVQDPRDDGNESFSTSFADSDEVSPLRDSSLSFDSTSGTLPNISISSISDLEQSTYNASSVSHDSDPFWTKDSVSNNVTSSSKVLDKNKGHTNSSKSPRNQSVQSLDNENGNSSSSLDSSHSAKAGNQMMKLNHILKKAAMPNKTVILTTLNAAWTTPGSIFDLFMESFRIGDQTKPLLKHLIIIALDQTAFSRCKEVHPHCYVLKTEGVNFTDEAAFMSKDYLALMWRRIEFLGVVLETGYNFIFTDADVLWFRNPLPHLHEDADFQIACDYYLYNSTDKNNKPNGGFTYVKSNNRSIEFYKFWHSASKRIPGTHDQDVFNIIKNDPLFDQIGLRMRFLTTAYYGGFCQQSEDLNLVCTMHANCCVGIDHKIHDLKMLIDDWKRYMALSNEEKRSKSTSFTVPRLCGPETAMPISNLP